jgi:hypothetical protein
LSQKSIVVWKQPLLFIIHLGSDGKGLPGSLRLLKILLNHQKTDMAVSKDAFSQNQPVALYDLHGPVLNDARVYAAADYHNDFIAIVLFALVSVVVSFRTMKLEAMEFSHRRLSHFSGISFLNYSKQNPAVFPCGEFTRRTMASTMHTMKALRFFWLTLPQIR